MAATSRALIVVTKDAALKERAVSWQQRWA